jgi:DNA-binding IclR family transcriptional regulator
MVYIEVCHGGQMFRMRVDVGSVVPFGTTAMGRAYMCAISEKERDSIMKANRKAMSQADWTSHTAGIAKALRDHSEHGFCASFGDWSKDVFAVGTPLASRDGLHILALNCSGPIFDMSRQRMMSDIGPRLVAMRDRILATVGGIF